MISTPGKIDWGKWLARWDEQQIHYIPHREERFEVMLDTLELLLPDDFVALDLACGPGAISQRLLHRFPKARAVAVDMNPVLLKLGQEVLGDAGGRLTWGEVNLRSPEWVTTVKGLLRQFDRTHFDAVLSTTALHWLPVDDLTRVYRQIGRILHPQGVFLNGDDLPFSPNQPTFRRLAEQSNSSIRHEAFVVQQAEDYQQWWQALEQEIRTLEPALNTLLDTYHQTESERPRDFSKPILKVHEAALFDAGFVEVDTLWQEMAVRILLAIKGE